MNSKEEGNGVEPPARVKEKAWDALLGKTKRSGERGGGEKLANSLAKVNPGSWRLLIRIHSTDTRQTSEPAARGRGPPSSQGEVSSRLRREGLLSRRGVTWGPNWWGSEGENPNTCSEKLSKNRRCCRSSTASGYVSRPVKSVIEVTSRPLTNGPSRPPQGLDGKGTDD